MQQHWRACRYSASSVVAAAAAAWALATSVLAVSSSLLLHGHAMFALYSQSKQVTMRQCTAVATPKTTCSVIGASVQGLETKWSAAHNILQRRSTTSEAVIKASHRCMASCCACSAATRFSALPATLAAVSSSATRAAASASRARSCSSAAAAAVWASWAPACHARTARDSRC